MPAKPSIMDKAAVVTAGKFPSFLSGGGEMGELIRNFDWSSTPLGAPDNWPGSLRTLTQVMLTSQQPMFIAWGPERIMLYNDGYAPMLANRHPWGLGRPFSEVWADIIESVGPIMDSAYAGQPTYMDDIEFQMIRHGQRVETHFSFGYTPVPGRNDSVDGMFCTAIETTAKAEQAKARTREAQRLRDMLESAPSFMAVLTGPDHVFEVTNASYLQLIGHHDVIGKPVREALPEVAGQGFYELLDEVYRSGKPFIGRGLPIDLQAKPGGSVRKAYLDFIYQPMRDEAGDVTGIFVEGSDVTDQKLAELAQRQSEVQIRVALAAAEMGVWECQVSDGRFENLKGDERAIDLLGGTPGQPASFDSFLDRVHPEDKSGLIPAAQRALDPEGDGILDVEYRLVSPDKAPVRWMHVRAQAVTDTSGTRLIGTVRDVTSRREAEDQQLVLSGELQHRVKNTLAMVSAIAIQTLRGDDIADRRTAFTARLEALAHAHDLLTAKTWKSAPIQAVVESALTPHLSGAERFVLDGVNIVLTAKQSLSMSLSIHELATNAAKYGAMSAPAGKVRIYWGADAKAENFVFIWQESGGPPVTSPSSIGFGSRLITRVLAADFDGQVKLEYNPAGLTCTLTAPLDKIVANNPGLADSLGLPQ